MHPTRIANPKAKRPKVKDKALDGMIEKAWEAGWWCRPGGGHACCYPLDGGRMVVVANTPSDHRTIPNTKSAFRKSGLDF